MNKYYVSQELEQWMPVFKKLGEFVNSYENNNVILIIRTKELESMGSLPNLKICLTRDDKDIRYLENNFTFNKSISPLKYKELEFLKYGDLSVEPNDVVYPHDSLQKVIILKGDSNVIITLLISELHRAYYKDQITDFFKEILNFYKQKGVNYEYPEFSKRKWSQIIGGINYLKELINLNDNIESGSNILPFLDIIEADSLEDEHVKFFIDDGLFVVRSGKIYLSDNYKSIIDRYLSTWPAFKENYTQ